MSTFHTLRQIRIARSQAAHIERSFFVVLSVKRDGTPYAPSTARPDDYFVTLAAAGERKERYERLNPGRAYMIIAL